MGTWGLGTFEDDIACDWLEDLYDSDPLAFFIQCLDLRQTNDLEFLACVGVVCTAEMIHALVLQPRPGLPEAALLWAQQHREMNVSPLVPIATAGLRRVMDGQSEMHQRWEDNEAMYESWLQRMRQLLRNLESAAMEKA